MPFSGVPEGTTGDAVVRIGHVPTGFLYIHAECTEKVTFHLQIGIKGPKIVKNPELLESRSGGPGDGRDPPKPARENSRSPGSRPPKIGVKGP